MGILGFLGTPLGYVMMWIYNFVGSYGWTIILFTLLVRIVSFPLQLKQQKSTARMSAYQPMITEIQKKYANDKEKQNQEILKMQQEYGYNPMASCLPTFLNMFVMFGVIEAIYYPLRHILHIGKDILEPIATGLGTTYSYLFDSSLIGMVKDGAFTLEQALAGGITAEQFASIQNFNIMFLDKIDLTQIPRLQFTGDALLLLIFPLLSVVTMALQNVITMRNSGQELQGSMKWMPWVMSLMFVTFSFRMPVAFSLYYTISNLLMLLQSVILKKIYDPEKMKAELAAEIEEKKKAKKAKKQVTLVSETGETITKAVNETELTRLRLEQARKRQQTKYADERTTPIQQDAPEQPE